MKTNINDDFFDDIDMDSSEDDDLILHAKEDYYDDDTPNPLVQNLPQKSTNMKQPIKEEKTETENTKTRIQASNSVDHIPRQRKPTLFESPIIPEVEETPKEEEEVIQIPRKQIILPKKETNDENDDFFASDDDNTENIQIKKLPPIPGLEPRPSEFDKPKTGNSIFKGNEIMSSKAQTNISKQQNQPQKEQPRRKRGKLHRK